MDGDNFSNEQAWMEAGQMNLGQPGEAPFDNDHFVIEWIDKHREPTEPPNPAYPNGTGYDLALTAKHRCRVLLPHPASRCGIWLALCTRCSYSVAVSTAGRPDDPKTLRLPCKPH
jgi:hypothetical protein